MYAAHDALLRRRPPAVAPSQATPAALQSPISEQRVPLRYGGQMIQPDHPYYDLIKRLILRQYMQAPVPGAQG